MVLGLPGAPVLLPWAALGRGDKDEALTMAAWATVDFVERHSASAAEDRDFRHLGSLTEAHPSIAQCGLACFLCLTSCPFAAAPEQGGSHDHVRFAGEEAQADGCSRVASAKQSPY